MATNSTHDNTVSWMQEGLLIHDVGVTPPRIWRMTNVVRSNAHTAFDAVCIATETWIAHHSISGAEKPGGWRIVPEMEALALNAMSLDEYRVWQKAWYQSIGAWHHRDEPK